MLSVPGFSWLNLLNFSSPWSSITTPLWWRLYHSSNCWFTSRLLSCKWSDNKSIELWNIFRCILCGPMEYLLYCCSPDSSCTGFVGICAHSCMYADLCMFVSIDRCMHFVCVCVCVCIVDRVLTLLCFMWSLMSLWVTTYLTKPDISTSNDFLNIKTGPHRHNSELLIYWAIKSRPSFIKGCSFAPNLVTFY